MKAWGWRQAEAWMGTPITTNRWWWSLPESTLTATIQCSLPWILSRRGCCSSQTMMPMYVLSPSLSFWLFLSLFLSRNHLLSPPFFSYDWILRNVFLVHSLAPPTYWSPFFSFFLYSCVCVILIRLSIRPKSWERSRPREKDRDLDLA